MYALALYVFMAELFMAHHYPVRVLLQYPIVLNAWGMSHQDAYVYGFVLLILNWYLSMMLFPMLWCGVYVLGYAYFIPYHALVWVLVLKYMYRSCYADMLKVLTCRLLVAGIAYINSEGDILRDVAISVGYSVAMGTAVLLWHALAYACSVYNVSSARSSHLYSTSTVSTSNKRVRVN